MNFSQIYARMCEVAGKSGKLRKIQDPPEDLQENLDLVDLELIDREVVALASLGTLVGGGIAGAVLLITWIFNLPLTLPVIVSLLPILSYFSIGWYPSWMAEKKRTESMEGIPLLISYLTAALKINPNLERAARFSAQCSDKSVVKNFRSELWKFCMGVHSSVGESLSKFGQHWRSEGEELKRSIDLLKSSVSEKSKAARERVLDRALKTCFEGVQDRMESFASTLRLPTTIIYGIGVLLPLIMLAVLPVVSSTGIQISGLELALVYCLVLPTTIYALEKEVLGKRPTPFPTPVIPSKDDEKKAALASVLTASIPPIIASSLSLPHSLVVLTLIWGLASGIATFCYLSSVETFQLREMNRILDEELCDALTQLGTRMKGGRPAEDAFKRTVETTGGSEISKILRKTVANLKVGGMSTESALFDPEEGSLKEVHSGSVKHAFRMLVHLLDRSTQAAGEAVLHTAHHLKNLREVERRTRRTLQEIVSSMRSVALFFAPFVASITVQFQQVLSKMTYETPFFGNGVQITSSTFLGILGLYVIILTMLLSSYVTEIERGDDNLAKRMSIAQALPVAMAVFTFGLFVSDRMLSILVG